MTSQAKHPRTALQKQGHLGLWKVMAAVSVVSTTLLGLVYLAAQIIYLEGRVDDPLFVVVIILNTIVAAGFGFHFDDRLRGLITAFNTYKKDPADHIAPEQAFRNIFNSPFAPLYAVVHAGFVASWVYLLAPWSPMFTLSVAPRDLPLDLLLTAFLFCGNLMIGYGVFCIVRFWLLAARRIAKVELDIFNPTRPDIALYQDISKRIVILVAFVATLAVISLAGSKFDIGTTTILFSLASLTAVAITYLAPMMPLTAKFQETRFAELDRVERRIEALYQQVVTAEDPSPFRKTLDEFTRMREEVRKVKTLPPGGEFSIFAAFGVSLLTFVPTIVQKVFDLILVLQ